MESSKRGAKASIPSLWHFDADEYACKVLTVGDLRQLFLIGPYICIDLRYVEVSYPEKCCREAQWVG